MGTRSYILFQDKTAKYMLIYQQYDGYPSGVGMKLVKFIKSKQFVNGYNDKDTQFNGFGCFLAQYICHIKCGVAGGAYVHPIDQKLDEEFNYVVTCQDDDTMTFSVNGSKEMTLDEFERFCSNYSEEDEE